MASDLILSTSFSQRRWVSSNTMILLPFQTGDTIIDITPSNHQQTSTDITSTRTVPEKLPVDPVSIFRVPETISSQKPEAYAPQSVGIGPYHHLRSPFYHTESHKIDAIRKLVEIQGTQTLVHLAVERVKKLESRIRSCYNFFLDLDCDVLAWIIAIDALFVIGQLSHEKEEMEYLKPFVNLFFGDPLKMEVSYARDIFVLENQIPVFVLHEINNISSPDKRIDIKRKLFVYCRHHSPLRLAPPDTSAAGCCHLIDFLYNLIISREDDNSYSATRSLEERFASLDDRLKGMYIATIHEYNLLFRKLANLNVYERVSSRVDYTISQISMPKDETGGEKKSIVMDAVTAVAGVVSLGNLVSALQKIPWKQLVSSKSAPSELDACRVAIPSASQLSVLADVEFLEITAGGIKNIKIGFEGEEDTEPPATVWSQILKKIMGESSYKNLQKKCKICLPVITLDGDSEVILRNLLAYEQVLTKTEPSKSPLLSSYMDLMSALIKTPKDVKSVRGDGKIIVSSLSDQKIVDLFRGIKTTTWELDYAFARDVNNFFKSKMKVKFYGFLGQCGSTLVKIVSSVAVYIIVAIALWEGFCSLFGCSSNITLSSFSISSSM